MSEKDRKIRVAISIGDYNGIGIEVILKTLQEKEITEFFTPVIFGSTKLLSYQKDRLKFDRINFQGIHDASQIKKSITPRSTKRTNRKKQRY